MKPSEARRMGKARFMLIHGSLYWGVPVGVFSELINRVRLHGGFHLYMGGNLWASFIARIVFFGLAGLAFGHFLWKGLPKEDPTPDKGATAVKTVRRSGSKARRDKRQGRNR